MEKRKPTYDLKTIQKLLQDESKRIITKASNKNAALLGYMTVEEICLVVDGLTQGHFYKSMTSEQIAGLWQDVYRTSDGTNGIYIKLQMSVDGKKAVLIQFKKDGGQE